MAWAQTSRGVWWRRVIFMRSPFEGLGIIIAKIYDARN
jgi:hypothetical protein